MIFGHLKSNRNEKTKVSIISRNNLQNIKVTSAHCSIPRSLIMFINSVTELKKVQNRWICKTYLMHQTAMRVKRYSNSSGFSRLQLSVRQIHKSLDNVTFHGWMATQKSTMLPVCSPVNRASAQWGEMPVYGDVDLFVRREVSILDPYLVQAY